ncbi:uncharacterized protein FTOL_03713 [Fusarium torulosum]|uniref:Uncharacterized protein n=1 Tax=Fusarium torulosum TaxID=33205 RepID=A0AAE8M4E0_9HYPO|nr:uncharacterized protein FTOL_03713 [Fusarium torulosum]
MLFNNAIVVFALSVSVNAYPQPYPNKCGDQVCPADKAKCCEVIVNGVAELGCFAECPPIQALERRQAYPNKCGDQVCPADKAKCCEVIVNGVAEIGCFAECPPIQALERRQAYPNKCGDQVCPADKAKCCEVIVNGVAEIGCFAECPPIQALEHPQAKLRNREEPPATTAASPPIPTFGPKCGDSFFCPVGQVCCPDALYHCADPDKVSEQCPW